MPEVCLRIEDAAGELLARKRQLPHAPMKEPSYRSSRTSELVYEYRWSRTEPPVVVIETELHDLVWHGLEAAVIVSDRRYRLPPKDRFQVPPGSVRQKGVPPRLRIERVQAAYMARL